VFGDPPRVAYRLRAKTDTISLAWSHALSARASLNLTYRYQISASDEDLGNYYSNFVGIACACGTHAWKAVNKPR
jgi:hypothetical protein